MILKSQDEVVLYHVNYNVHMAAGALADVLYEYPDTLKVSVENVKELQDRLAKIRSLLFLHEVKAKRIKNTKSKTYRRLSKKDRLKAINNLKKTLLRKRRCQILSMCILNYVKAISASGCSQLMGLMVKLMLAGRTNFLEQIHK